MPGRYAEACSVIFSVRENRNHSYLLAESSLVKVRVEWNMSFRPELHPKNRPPPVRKRKAPPTTASPPPSSTDSDPESEHEIFHDARFPPEEEAALLAESQRIKSEANALFTTSRFSEAVSAYDRAIASLPNYLDYELAVLKSNIAACHVKLEEWKQAIEAANAALEALDREDPPPKEKGEKAKSKEGERNSKASVNKSSATEKEQSDAIVELDDDDDDSAALEKLQLSDARKADISRIRAKTLMRRARARSSLAGWANLAGAEEDYKFLSSDPRLSQILPPSDMKVIRAGLSDLPQRIAVAKEAEMGEMMDKLKELGNGILKPFGLSTDNFKMVKDEKTGGYSMNFEQNPKK
jgi:tetratricopeptide (TPR) repeat protein